MKISSLVVGVLVAFSGTVAFSQGDLSDPAMVALPQPPPPLPAFPSPAPPLSNEELAARLGQLEADNQRMRAEMESMRQNASTVAPQPLQGVMPMPAPVAPPAPVIQSAPVVQSGPSLGELQGEMKKLAWSKGDMRIVPYGYLWGNMVGSTQRTAPGSYTLFVQSPTLQDESEFVIDARNTRLGVDVLGPRIPLLGCAQSGGKVEIDFQGSMLGVTSQENRGTILLRHAYCEVKNEEFRLLVGQTWDVISPLLPGMLMYSVAWDAGNIGFRRAQVRGERYWAYSDTALVTVQASLNQTPFESTGNVRSEFSDWPVGEGRLGLTLGDRKGPDALPITMGISGHGGQEQFDIVAGPQGLRRSTWSANIDFRFPLTKRFGFQAEFFTGENLGSYLGGIGQDIDPTTLQGIHSTGGWCELWYDWTPCLHSHVGYSLDDPDNNNLHTVGQRTYNQCVFANVSYDLTKQFLVGLEVSQWKTLYRGQLPGDSTRIEFVAKYGF